MISAPLEVSRNTTRETSVAQRDAFQIRNRETAADSRKSARSPGPTHPGIISRTFGCVAGTIRSLPQLLQERQDEFEATRSSTFKPTSEAPARVPPRREFNTPTPIC